MSTSAGTTVVNVSPDTALNLSEFVCFLVEARRPEAGRSLFAECSAHISGAETELLLAKLVDQTEDVLQAEREADAEGCFQAMVPILFTLQHAEQQARLIRRIIAALTASDSSRATLRLRVLVSVFNLVVSVAAKYELLTGAHTLSKLPSPTVELTLTLQPSSPTPFARARPRRWRGTAVAWTSGRRPGV